ncbi:MAG: hypothetical protein R3C05_31105 [Pirellulaceae bacterium]
MKSRTVRKIVGGVEGGLERGRGRPLDEPIFKAFVQGAPDRIDLGWPEGFVLCSSDQWREIGTLESSL